MSVEAAYIGDGIRERESFKERFKERRGRLGIIADILSVAMEETEYTSALWIKQNINGSLVCNDYLLARRTLAISEVPILTGYTSDLVFGFVSKDDLMVKSVSPISPRFYTDTAFTLEDPSSGTKWRLRGLLVVPIDNEIWGKQTISKYNLTHVVENDNIQGRYTLGEGVYHSTFLELVHEKKQKVYSNGHISIWEL